VGPFILAFGRFGFNAGSTLAGSDLRIGVIATNTVLAGAAGGITSMLYMWLRGGKRGRSAPLRAMLLERSAAREAA
jgi:Amt family ammonium transporter